MQIDYAYDAAGNRTEVKKSVAIHITTSSVQNLRTIANNSGYTGSAGARYYFIVDAGVTITAPPHGIAIDTGIWPADALLTIAVSGSVYGGGGAGGAGSATGDGAPGQNGGYGIIAHAPLTVIVNSTGVIKGGGGGGGGGGYTAGTTTVGGDGGGGGFPNGPGGAGSSGTSGDAAAAGANGTTAGGGGGGSSGPPGGHGGAAGTVSIAGTSSTGAGGIRAAGGNAVRKNGFAVTVINNGGTIVGNVG